MKQQTAVGLPARKWVYSLFIIISFFFIFISEAIGDLSREGNVIWNASYLADTLLLSALLGLILGSCLGYLYLHWAKRPKRPAKTIGLSGAALFWLSTLLLLLAWLPYFLAYYPCIGAYDINNQMWQIGNDFYYDHHPLMHTLTLRFFVSAGQVLFKSENTGLALYTIVQMFLLALSMSYGILILRKFKVRAGAIIAALLFCMLYPFHGFLSVSVTKDVYFTAFFTVLAIAMTSLLLDPPGKKFRHEYVLIVIATVGSILYRNNGKFAILVPMALLLLLVIFRKNNRKFYAGLLLLLTIGFIAGNLILPGLSKALDADQGDKREMLSMPIQQFARCMIYHGGVEVLPEDDNTMTEAQKSLTKDFLLHEGYQYYLPQLSDPVKSHTNTALILYRPKAFIKTYVDLFLRYPGDFVNAALAVNAGYLSPFDETHANIYSYATRPNLGYVQTYWQKDELEPWPVYQDSKWPWLYEKMQEWTDENGYLEYPLFIRLFFVPGSYFWAYVLLAAHILLKKNYRMFLPLSYIAGFYLTLFLGPCVQLRYLYPVMVVLPFLILLSGAKAPAEETS